MSKKLNINLKGFLPLFVLLSVLACKKEITNIGVNLRPDGGAIYGTEIMISDIVARTIAEDSLRTDSLSTNLLGVINDPIFGESRASIICQPRLSDDNYNFTGATLDSITLTIKFKRSQIVDGIEQIALYGDLDDPIDLDVYKVDEDLIKANRYYSNSNIALGDLVGSYSGRFYFYDSVEVKQNGDTFNVGPELHIRLNDAFGIEMLNQASSVYTDDALFLDYLKGLALVPRLNQASGKGIIAGIDVNNPSTVLNIHYNGTEMNQFEFNSGSERIGLYDIVNQNSSIVSQKNGSGHFNTTYVQAMGGAKVKIDIPGLDSIIEKGELIVINEAKISVKVKSGTADIAHKVPYRMLLLEPDPVNGGNYPIIDFIDQVSPPTIDWLGNTNYGGKYSSSLNGYEFHFNRHLQSLIETYNKTGVNTFNGFYLVIPSDFPIAPARAVLDSDLSSSGIEVSITYTKLN